MSVADQTIMIAHERQQLILTLLREQSPLTVPELEQRLRASPATVRRDLTFLEQLGKIVRTHGGLMHPDDATGEMPFDRKSRAALAAKQGIADAAAELVKPGDTVFVDAGTTVLEVGKKLLGQKDLTIVTNSIPLLPLRPVEGTRVISIGGEVRIVSLALVGAATSPAPTSARPSTPPSQSPATPCSATPRRPWCRTRGT